MVISVAFMSGIFSLANAPALVPVTEDGTDYETAYEPETFVFVHGATFRPRALKVKNKKCVRSLTVALNRTAAG